MRHEAERLPRPCRIRKINYPHSHDESLPMCQPPADATGLLNRVGDDEARSALLDHACDRMRLLTRRMLRQYRAVGVTRLIAGKYRLDELLGEAGKVVKTLK